MYIRNSAGDEKAMEEMVHDIFHRLYREEIENTFSIADAIRIYDSEEDRETYISASDTDDDDDDDIPISYNTSIENLPDHGTRMNPVYVHSDDGDDILELICPFCGAKRDNVEYCWKCTLECDEKYE